MEDPSHKLIKVIEYEFYQKSQEEVRRLKEKLEIATSTLWHFQSNGSLYGKENLEKKEWWLANRTSESMAIICADVTKKTNEALDKIKSTT